jgi:hypothetical protein
MLKSALFPSSCRPVLARFTSLRNSSFTSTPQFIVEPAKSPSSVEYALVLMTFGLSEGVFASFVHRRDVFQCPGPPPICDFRGLLSGNSVSLTEVL